jgi:hypothetical protein
MFRRTLDPRHWKSDREFDARVDDAQYENYFPERAKQKWLKEERLEWGPRRRGFVRAGLTKKKKE